MLCAVLAAVKTFTSDQKSSADDMQTIIAIATWF
jgi:hypothetical protein